jgi:hypothetical protein
MHRAMPPLMAPTGAVTPPWRWRSPDLAALLLVGCVFALNVYRAATQSITHDEAFAYERVMTWTWLRAFTLYRENHHILQTYLAKASVGLFGLSELSLRLPSLLGGLAYLVFAVRLARHAFASAWIALLAVALLALDPDVLDHLSAARGYGLGLAFFTAGLFEMARSLDAPEEAARARSLTRAGVAVGLAAASNLTYVWPGAALSLALGLVLARDAASGPQRRAAVAAWARRLVAPGAAAFLAVAGVPLVNLRRHMLYAGAPTLLDSARDVFQASFARHAPLRAALPPRWDAWTWAGASAFACAVLLLSGGYAAAALVRRARRAGPTARARSRAEALLALVGAGSAITLALLVVAHAALGIRYPEARMALYWVPLAYLGALALVEASWRRAASRVAVALPLLAFCAVALASDALQLDATHYETWTYDRSSRRYVELIRAHRGAGGGRPVSVGMTWLVEPAFKFYRLRDGLSWMELSDRRGPRGAFDWYVLVGEDRQLVREYRLVEVARDDLAETVLAAPRPAGGG